jgi:hypothetical protein
MNNNNNNNNNLRHRRYVNRQMISLTLPKKLKNTSKKGRGSAKIDVKKRVTFNTLPPVVYYIPPPLITDTDLEAALILIQLHQKPIVDNQNKHEYICSDNSSHSNSG